MPTTTTFCLASLCLVATFSSTSASPFQPVLGAIGTNFHRGSRNLVENIQPRKYIDDEDVQEDVAEDTNTIPGVAGSDYPLHGVVPLTGFSCKGHPAGTYADQLAGCQAWHLCPEKEGQMESFLCPNGTMYNQVNRVCEWWFNVDCRTQNLRKDLDDQNA